MLNETDIQRIFRAVPGCFLVLRPDAAFTIAAASADYLRAAHTDESIFGRALFDVFPPDGERMQNLGASLQQVLASGGSPVLTEDGTVAYVVHRMDDTGAKESRSAVDILESITEGFFTLDRQWRFDYVNREAHRILERELSDLSGKVLWDVYPGLEGTEFERNYHRTMYERVKASFTAFYPAQERWYEVTTFPAPEGVSVYFRNVTERKMLEAERERLVAESERQQRIYETALNSTPDFVYVFDTEHRALYANDALLKTWGVDDVLGKRWTELGYEQWHADLHDAEIETVIATRAPIRGEIPFTGTNGTRVYDYIFAPVLSAHGDVVAVAGTTRDITERQAAEQAAREQAERLAQADLAKDEFLATLSHELRNPLAPLRTAIELLRKIGTADERSTRLHAMMDRQITHLVRLVDDLLEMSRISRGTLSLRRERVALSAVVGNALETSDPLIKAAGHALVVELPGEPMWLEGDPVRLAQIVANLLNNAAKYTENNGRIVVKAWRESGNAAISVTDNGIGIEPDMLPRLFEMFSRGNRDSGRNQGGLGIGLALSRQLARMHDGTLDAASDGPGAGSVFTVRLPAAEAGVDAIAEPAEAASLARTRVLVVDDNVDAADSLGLLLDSLGAEVRVANSGATGLEIVASWEPAVVLLDIGMPGMNGYEVARAICSRFRETRPALVALTGWGQEDDRRRAADAGFDHHMVKPANLDALQTLLTSIVA